MKDIADIRRERLAEIVQRDGLSSAAKRFGKPDSQINDMLAKRKSFGEKVARAMERSYDPSLPQGWLDQDHRGDTQQEPSPEPINQERDPILDDLEELSKLQPHMAEALRYDIQAALSRARQGTQPPDQIPNNPKFAVQK